MKYLVCFTISLATTVIFTSCSSARLTSSWTNDTYTAQSYDKVLVFTIASKTSNKAAVEGAMTAEMKKQGINAVSSLSIFPAKLNGANSQQNKISREELAQAMEEHHIDGLLVLSLLDKKEEQVYVEGHTYTQSETIKQGVYSEPIYNRPEYDYYNYHPNGYSDRYDQYYNNFYSYYETVQTTVTEPGYYENETTLYLESNFYKVSDASLVWSGQTEVVNPTDLNSGATDWSRVVVKALVKQQVVLPQSSNPGQ